MENNNNNYANRPDRGIVDPNFRKITYDKNGNKIYPPQPRKYAAGSLEMLWFFIPLDFFLFAIGGAGGLSMGVFFTWVYLKDKQQEMTRRWRMECDHEEKYLTLEQLADREIEKLEELNRK